MNERTSPQFHRFLAEGNIVCQTSAASSNDVIAELADRLAFTTAGLRREEIIEAVREREAILPTVIASGLAVPHARLAQADQLLIALATSRNGIDFQVPDMPPVKVVVLILTPRNDPGLHLQLLAALARDFRDPGAIDQLAALPNAGRIMEYFNGNDVEIPKYLRARDLMQSDAPTLLESDTLHRAIETFARGRAEEIPILDDEGDLRGVISQADILKFSLPEHILWMDDLTPIYQFQPFAEMLKADQETKLADFMREDPVVVDEELPAIQLAKLFLMKKIGQILVSSAGKYAGVVNLDDFNRKLFWE